MLVPAPPEMPNTTAVGTGRFDLVVMSPQTTKPSGTLTNAQERTGPRRPFQTARQGCQAVSSRSQLVRDRVRRAILVAKCRGSGSLYRGGGGGPRYRSGANVWRGAFLRSVGGLWPPHVCTKEPAQAEGGAHRPRMAGRGASVWCRLASGTHWNAEERCCGNSVFRYVSDWGYSVSAVRGTLWAVGKPSTGTDLARTDWPRRQLPHAGRMPQKTDRWLGPRVSGTGWKGQSRRPSSMISSTSANIRTWYSLSLMLNRLPVSLSGKSRLNPRSDGPIVMSSRASLVGSWVDDGA